MAEIRPITGKLEKVELKDLHIQFVPVVTPVKLWNHDMSLENSPHVELMRILLEHGLDWKRIEPTRYVKERTRRFAIGLKRWVEKKIMGHIEVRYDILKSIKKKGFKKSRQEPIMVLKEPFWKTRFGHEFPQGYEIWTGAGRASAAYVLGYEKLPVMFYEDKYAGSNKKGRFEKKLKGVQGVWDA